MIQCSIHAGKFFFFLAQSLLVCIFVPLYQTGCLGCASGKGAGPRNIFGNKYGQNLAAVQIARERRAEEKQRLEAERAKKREQEALQKQQQADCGESDGDAETDDDTDDEGDYGPSPAAGVWAGSQKLQAETEQIEDGGGNDDHGGDDGEPAAKKSRSE